MAAILSELRVPRVIRFLPRHLSRHGVAVAALLALSSARPARAGGAAPEEAAAAFDRAVSLYRAGEATAAAREFLRADDLVHNVDALQNALAAAEASHDDTVRALAARRILGRPGVPAELVARAGALEAGLAGAAKPAPAPDPPAPGPKRVPAAAEPEAEPEAEAMASPAGDAHTRPIAARGLPPAVFYGGLAVTSVVAAVTVWSGLDTLAARRDLPAAPTREQNDDVRARITRSNVLFAGTVLAAGATGYVGLSLVDWRDPRSAVFSYGGRF